MKEKRKLRVGVMMAGMSSERRISLASGRNMYDNLDPEKYIAIPIFLDTEGRLWEIDYDMTREDNPADIAARLEKEAKRIYYEDLLELVDFVLLGLHGKYGEDGCMQGLLELLGIPYSGSGVLASALGMDKYMQRKVLKEAGVDVPKHIAVMEEEWKSDPEGVARRIEQEIGFPCICKPSREGCTHGTHLVRGPEDLQEAMESDSEDLIQRGALKFDKLVLFEELVVGMEFTCGVIGNDDPIALMPTETVKKGCLLTEDEKFIQGEGDNITPARLPEEAIKRIQEIVVKAYKALNLKVCARLDGIIEGEYLDEERTVFKPEGRIVILEPNTLPGMTMSSCIFHQAAEAGMDSMEFMDKIIELSLEAHRRKRGPL